MSYYILLGAFCFSSRVQDIGGGKELFLKKQLWGKKKRKRDAPIIIVENVLQQPTPRQLEGRGAAEYHLQSAVPEAASCPGSR